MEIAPGKCIKLELPATKRKLRVDHDPLPPTPRRFLALLLAAASLQLTLWLGRAEVTGPFEGRVAATAREMLASGDWIVPHLNGTPRLQKPPLPYWCTATLWKLTDSVDPLWLRLTPAVLGAASTFLLARLVRRCAGEPAGLIAAGLWISTPYVVESFREGTADPYLAALCLCAIDRYLEVDARLGAGRRAAVPALLAWGALALAAMAKGPVALLHVLVAAGAFHLAWRRPPRWTWSHLGGAVLFAAITLPWPLLVAGRVPGAMELWMRESLGQVVSERNPRAWWYYLPQPFYLALPWTPLLLLAFPLGWKNLAPRARRGVLWFGLWLGASLVAFSCSRMKKNAYLLPVAPALLGAGAIVLQGLVEQARGAVRSRAGWGSLVAIACLMLLGMIGCAVATAPAVLAPPTEGVFWVTATLSLAVILHSLRRASFWSARGEHAESWALRRLLQAAGIAALAVHWKAAWLEPARNNADSPGGFLEHVAEVAAGAELHSWGPLGEAAIYRLGRVVPVLGSEAEVPEARGFLLARQNNLPGALAGLERVAAEELDRPGQGAYVLLRLPGSS